MTCGNFFYFFTLLSVTQLDFGTHVYYDKIQFQYEVAVDRLKVKVTLNFYRFGQVDFNTFCFAFSNTIQFLLHFRIMTKCRSRFSLTSIGQRLRSHCNLVQKWRITVHGSGALINGLHRVVGYKKTIGPIHTKFGMGIHLGERNSYADFGGGTFKVKVTRALCY